ncbi:MAG TPA: hypothetical protein VF713_01775, partial [Thermoanaerobaculia bacterium]
MNPLRARCVWVGAISVLSSAMLVTLTGCASLASSQTARATPSVSAASLPSEDDDWSQLKAQMRIDLNRYNSREIARTSIATPPAVSTQSRDREFNKRAQALFTPLSRMPLRLPVVGVRSSNLDDSWHAPRDGGARVHKGIDIFAPKGTEVVAVV